MKFNKLRCVGFKSFVEPTEFLIEEGLTGVVGPNGCGKSNLVEALRWAMGENSYKNMRASGMDDVIFSGSSSRPSRNTAEVSLFLDNRERTAPAAFNDMDELQVSRRIEREAGSVYRINGREARAKDVQLLFADASTGARSPSMVGQGRVGELISAKPQARRALLEEAAGISGLHSRRHEAELRLRAADQNLERLDDVIGQLDTQLDSLKRQARQANRYRNLSTEIRSAEALVLHLKWSAAKTAETEARSLLAEATGKVGEKAEAQAVAARQQAERAAGLPKLRENEAQAAAALQRLTLARDQVAEEIRRIGERKAELEKRIAQLDEDLQRERRLVDENAEYLERLDAEKRKLAAGAEEHESRAGELQELLDLASEKLAEREKGHAQLTDETASARARRGETERAISQAEARAAEAERKLSEIEKELADLAEKLGAMDGPARARERVEAMEKQAAEAENRAGNAESVLEAARKAEQELRTPLAEAGSRLDRIEAEIATLNRILDSGAQDMFAAVIEKMTVEPGYEAALGAALGADLDLPLDEGAPARWSMVAVNEADPALPDGVRPMAEVVDAPPELARRLAQTGIVDEARGGDLVQQLAPGQLLVSKRGDVWRWDGYVAGADAPTAAAQKLAQKNRLAELDIERKGAASARDAAAEQHSEAQRRTAELEEADRAAREAWRQAGKDLASARDELLAAERAVADLSTRRDKLTDARDRAAAEIEENRAAKQKAESELENLPDMEALDARLEESRSELAEQRAALAEIRSDSDAYTREMESRRARHAEIERELGKWRERTSNAEAQIEKLEARRQEAGTELGEIADAPEQAEARRAALMDQVEEAEAKRRGAADILATSENELAEADRAAKQADAELSEAREAKVRAEERQSSAEGRTREIEARIREELDCAPAEALGRAELTAEDTLPDLAATEGRLEKLKAERERLGAVNLRAEAEQQEISQQRDTLISERDDLIEAIKRLRSGISSLNREGRERLLEAFERVNGHFAHLFTHLFGGGTAELQLVESDDPLDAGLEIVARPPGKRPQTMTLLSGGEQALTALALIFAVFLTNPAPICVLDEVDAPLDDHNVERFCNLMDEMVASTQTRFVIITHNPITMSRMNRLFGVTMAERGVSEIVSVNLEEAERLREAV